MARVVHRHEPCDHDVVVEPAEGRQSEVLAGPGWGGYGLLVVEQASSSGVAATPPLMHITPPLVGHFLMLRSSSTTALSWRGVRAAAQP